MMTSKIRALFATSVKDISRNWLFEGMTNNKKAPNKKKPAAALGAIVEGVCFKSCFKAIIAILRRFSQHLDCCQIDTT